LSEADKPSATPAEASDALRDLIRILSQNGVTYSDLVRKIDAQWGWNGNALKQMVARASIVRKSSKNSSLIYAVEASLKDCMGHSDSWNSIARKIDQMNILLGSEFTPNLSDVDSVTKMLGNRFQSIRRASTLYEYPERAAFVRWDWERRRLISVLIDTRKGRDGHVFIMKITGQNSRRIVIGDVLVTLQNTYYSGLAYEVSVEMNQKEFVGLNAFDLDAVRDVTGPSEIGLECFTISNEYVNRRTAPVTFHGLDGRGNPISGLGAFIKAPAFDSLKISEEDFSSVECSIKNQALTKLMSDYAAITLGPTSSGQFTDKTCIGKLPKEEHSEKRLNGWAYLKENESDETEVHFPQAFKAH
jgi:hypothetical protein